MNVSLQDPRIMLVAVGVALLLAGVALGGESREPVILPSPAEALTVLQAQESRDLASGGGGLPRAVVAFAAPDGAVLGPIEAGRAYSFITADRGWLHLNIEGSGRVWVRSSDLAGTTILPVPEEGN